ncbi:MAG: FAD/NAD(P)-binding protein [Gemmataceae bacterium]
MAANPQTIGHPVSSMLPAVVRVREHRRETADVFTLSVEPPAPFAFRPGQFNMLYVFGVGEAAISLSSASEEPATLQHTIRAVGSVTNALARLQPGDALGMRGPFGSVWPMEAARGCDVVIVTGGIGLAPLRPAIYHLLRHRPDYGRLVLLYGARAPADLLYTAELDQWQQHDDVQVLVTVDRGEPSWSGAVGLVTSLFPRITFDPKRTIGLMCGPEIMMRFTVREFEKRGVTGDRLYLSLERNMQCAIGFCGHCQLGPTFVCMDGPVFRYDRIQRFFHLHEA